MLKEYRSFLFHNLTNQKKITNNCVCFVTAFRSILPVQSGLGMLSLLLAFVDVSRMDVLVSFSCVSSTCSFGCSVTFVTWSVRASSVALVWRLETAA